MFLGRILRANDVIIIIIIIITVVVKINISVINKRAACLADVYSTARKYWCIFRDTAAVELQFVSPV